MKKKLIILSAILLVCSCSDFWEKAPANEFDADLFFASEDDLILYANGLINAALPEATDMTLGEDVYTDLCGTLDSKEFYRGTYNAGKASNWTTNTWSFPRRVAYMLENMPNCKESVSEELYNHYEGVARFWRAWITVKRMKTFGDVYFVDEVISADDTEALYAPREDREYVFHRVREDLEFACANCLESGAGIHTDGRIYINRYVALAFASRFFLYEGTYRKYHDKNPSTGRVWNNEYESPEELLGLAEKYSKELIDTKAFKLNPDYRSLFVSAVLPTDEVIWGRSYSSDLSVKHGTTYKYCSTTSSKQYSPTKEYVRMFLKTDGSLAESEISVTKEFEDRDKRLAATVLTPGAQWKAANGVNQELVPNWTWTRSGYQWIKWVQMEEDPFSGDSKSYNSVPIIRYGEILLNYAEAAAELGHMDQNIWNETIGALRARAGVKNIYPVSAEYVQDAWLRDYYTKDVMHPAEVSDIMLEIRRERVTELMLEGQSRYDDLMRWHLGDLIERRYNHVGWRGIYITEAEAKDGFIWAGKKFTIGKGASNEYNYKTSKSGDAKTWSLSEGTFGYLIYHYPLVWHDKMYTQPISLSALAVNPELGQNNGWQWN